MDNELHIPPPLKRTHRGRLTTDELKDRLRWIRDYVRLNFISPTYDEMAGAWGNISKSAVGETIIRLERYGWIVKAGKSARSIRLTARGENELSATQEGN